MCVLDYHYLRVALRYSGLWRGVGEPPPPKLVAAVSCGPFVAAHTSQCGGGCCGCGCGCGGQHASGVNNNNNNNNYNYN